MTVAIIGGTGVYGVQQHSFEPREIDTPYGSARVYIGQGVDSDLVFLARHGVGHTIPPHKINYRANMKALQILDVDRAGAFFAVGSVSRNIPPGEMVLLDQFIDFTHGREFTFFDGRDGEMGHIDMTHPYCPALREQILARAADYKLELQPTATYACCNGPRFETPAEVRMLGLLGCDVVGMTAATETSLACELGLHYSAVAISVNWGSGLAGDTIVEIDMAGLSESKQHMQELFIDVLRQPLPQTCNCTSRKL